MCVENRISVRCKKIDYNWVSFSVSTTVKKIDYNGLKMDFVASKNTNNLKPILIYYNHFFFTFLDTDNETQLYSVVFKELQCGKTKLCLV